MIRRVLSCLALAVALPAAELNEAVVARWAESVGRRWARLHAAGGSVPLGIRAQHAVAPHRTLAACHLLALLRAQQQRS